MSEPQTITPDHVRTLLEAEAGSMLVLAGGRVEVVPADQLDSETYRGALEVISQTELTQRMDADDSAEAVDREAAALTAATQTLGG